MSVDQEKINEIKQTFTPRISFPDLRKTAENDVEIASDAFYELLEDVTSRLKPSFKDKYESKWTSLFLPVERDGELICTAVSIFLSYKKIIYVTFTDISRYGGAAVDKGADEIPGEYVEVFDEITRFMPLVNEFGADLVREVYPYKWRSGRIKRKYTCDPSSLITREEGDALLAAYERHLAKNLTVSEISLNDYLNTAGLGYRAAFQEDIESMARREKKTELTNAYLHKRWADGRHGGMLFLKDPDSKKEYMDWLLSREWEGAHPFEIVYSGNVHGITLYPPNKKEPLYRLSVIDHFYNAETIKMTEVFMEHEIPFTVHDLEELVNYCRGESFADVNKFSMRGDMFQYEHTKEEEEEYFSHIEWEKLQILEAI